MVSSASSHSFIHRGLHHVMTLLGKRNNKRFEDKLQKHGKRSWIRRIEQEDDEDRLPRTRSWSEMDHEILVEIMNLLSWHDKAYAASCVCMSWLCASLDTLFPPSNVLDLRCLDDKRKSFNKRNFKRLCQLLDLHLRRDQAKLYTKLYPPCSYHKSQFYRYLSQRLPGIKVLVLPTDISLTLEFINVARDWKKMEEIHCFDTSILFISHHWNRIRRLGLSGKIGEDKAAMIVENLHQLTHLSLQYCCLLNNALSLLLQGQKNLVWLDTRHAYLGDGHFATAKDWNYEVFSKYTNTIERVLECGRNNCSDPSCKSVYFKWPRPKTRTPRVAIKEQ